MIKFLSFTLYFLVRLLNFTYRYRYVNPEVYKRSLEACGHHAMAVWHQNIIASLFSHLKTNYVVMASASKDGELVIETLRRLGHSAVRGSSKKKGQEALEKMIEKIKTKGLNSALTVDGPRGPAREVKRGIIEIARQTGAPILPTLAYPIRHWTFNSWDKFRLPKPFTRISVIYGEPIAIPEELSLEEFEAYREKIKNALNELELTFLKEKSYANRS